MKYLRSLTFAVVLAAATVPALAVDNIESSDAPDLTKVRALIAAKDFKSAITELNVFVEEGVEHADVYNLLGYSLRKSGDTKNALTYYEKALEFDPNHKGALEYMGELYVEIGEVGKAQENVARLEKLCPQGCEELEDLRQAVASAQPAKTN